MIRGLRGRHRRWLTFLAALLPLLLYLALRVRPAPVRVKAHVADPAAEAPR
jgi:hypothetical protein